MDIELFDDLSNKIVEIEDRSDEMISRLRLTFKNGYGISIVQGFGTYGLYEIAVLGKDGYISYDTPVTDDVEGCESAAEVLKYAREISELV